MSTLTRPSLVWQDTVRALYLRGPSPEPWLEHGGWLHGYAIRQPDGTWMVVDRTSVPKRTTTVADRWAAKAELERIAASLEAA